VQERIKRAILTGGLTGLLVAVTLALPSVLPPAIADDEPARTLLKTADQIIAEPVDADTFLRPEWTVEDWVSTDIIEQRVVRKIAFGRTTFVTINTTSTGTYSSDGLASPHIRYPGIVREAGSFVTIVPAQADGCVEVKYGIYC
jgi:hypothetical protein